jgi:hypothetical protein
MNKEMPKLKQKMTMEIVGTIALLLLVIIPVITLAKHKHKIYVDVSASGTQNGSSGHPFSTIKKALKEAGKDDEVHISKGTYKESIEIPSGVEVYGSDEDKVIIQGKSDDATVVVMGDKTKLNKVTVRKGGNGIEVRTGAEASIIKVVIKDNNKDGIKIRSARVNDDNKVSITDSVIKNNGRAGIYSEIRRIVIMNNEIFNNESDGISLASGTSAWIQGNNVKDNDGTGMKLVIDYSQILTKNNRFYGNEHGNMEINSYGRSGRIDINKAKIFNSPGFGIVRIQRGNTAENFWQNFTIQSNTEYSANKSGNVSPIIRVN